MLIIFTGNLTEVKKRMNTCPKVQLRVAQEKTGPYLNSMHQQRGDCSRKLPVAVLVTTFVGLQSSSTQARSRTVAAFAREHLILRMRTRTSGGRVPSSGVGSWNNDTSASLREPDLSQGTRYPIKCRCNRGKRHLAARTHRIEVSSSHIVSPYTRNG